MKRIIILLALLALPFIAFAQTDDAAPKDDRPSVTRGAEEVKYMGSVNGGLALLGFFLHTSHGVVFPDSNLYAGGSLQYIWIYGDNCIDIAVHGKCFFSEKGRVQGYVGLEAGLSVACRDIQSRKNREVPQIIIQRKHRSLSRPRWGLSSTLKRFHWT